MTPRIVFSEVKAATRPALPLKNYHQRRIPTEQIYASDSLVGFEMGTLAEASPTKQISMQAAAPRRTDPTMIATLAKDDRTATPADHLGRRNFVRCRDRVDDEQACAQENGIEVCKSCPKQACRVTWSLEMSHMPKIRAVWEKVQTDIDLYYKFL